MLRIAICDDEREFIEELKSKIVPILKAHHWKGSVTSFSNGINLINSNKKEKFDIIFLDIDMPERDGFSVAEQIVDRESLLIFCTSHNELVYNSFSYQPFWFLCKDSYVESLDEVLCAARKKLEMQNRNYEFNINGEIYNIVIDEILYFDVSKHRVHVHLKDGEQIDFRENLSKVEEVFDEYGFVRINSGCLVNMLWIKHIYQNDIELKNEEVLSLSRGRKSDVKERFHKYMMVRR